MTPIQTFFFLIFFYFSQQVYIIWTLSEIEYTKSSTNGRDLHEELSDRKIISRCVYYMNARKPRFFFFYTHACYIPTIKLYSAIFLQKGLKEAAHGS